MGVASGSSAPAAASLSSSRRQARDAGSSRSNRNNSTNNYANADMAAETEASSSQVPTETQPKPLEFPRTLAHSLRPAIATFTPHNDSLAKGLQYVTEATVEYEEFHGSQNSKTAGAKESTGATKRPPTSRAKAVQAAYADQMAFSADPRIHTMEDALLSIKEFQHQMEAEKQALERLTSIIAAGAALPVASSLEESYAHILQGEIKHIQARRKQEAIATVGMNPDLQEFRAKVWEVHHNTSAVPTSGFGNGGEDEDDEDMEIMVTGDGNNLQSLKCPLTTQFLEDPVTSAVCKHSFSSAAIRALIRSRPRSVCPVHGCNRPIALENLQPNKALARKVARQIMIQDEMSQRPEEEYATVD
ncbi:hypothetical protein EC957_006225 [Mortierella hygrophila]|uniref:SP-RING-type domain-containing protein n=1 Tax=Mortierella hygrophila TaxID=979708 RepID=A0A9P6F052_9FUNG|nr:hypothetical protein EC957_006225 [Mortierella hygrophila]